MAPLRLPCRAGSPSNQAMSGGRYDSSLGTLTRKFLQLLQSAPEGVLDLNGAADCLKVGGWLDGCASPGIAGAEGRSLCIKPH